MGFFADYANEDLTITDRFMKTRKRFRKLMKSIRKNAPKKLRRMKVSLTKRSQFIRVGFSGLASAQLKREKKLALLAAVLILLALIFNNPMFDFGVALVKTANVILLISIVVTSILGLFEPFNTLFRFILRNLNAVRLGMCTDWSRHFGQINPNNPAVDFDEIVSIASNGMGKKQATNLLSQIEVCYRRNADTLGLIVDPETGRIRGFLIVLPITNDGVGYILNGIFDCSEIAEAISTTTPVRFIYWHTVFLDDKCREDIDYVSAVCQRLLYKTRTFVDQDSGIVLAASSSRNGQRLLRRLGFEQIRSKVLGEKTLFALRLSDRDINPDIAQRLRDLGNVDEGSNSANIVLT